ncbi:MAG TPA: pitrilysin family protein [Pseudonocardiaceae bacterium]|nr:pitrilysin family protein [Pseudonocardiaceae bacterium]
MTTVVPELGRQPEIVPPETAQSVLANGLRVVAVRSSRVPLVELRLRVPFSSAEPGHSARAWLLAETLLSGVPGHDRMGVAERVMDLGGTLTAEVDPDQLLVSGTVLAWYLDDLLALLAEVLTGARYPEEEIAAERIRLVSRLTAARSQASVRAREALRSHLFGEHPYSHSLPEVDDVQEIDAADLRAMHARRVVPAGSLLVLVGDIEPDRAVAACEHALAGWRGTPDPVVVLPELPGSVPLGPSLLYHRPGSVQSSIRIGGPALRRDDPRYAALQLANLIYGGYFSGRMVENIREDKGYTYSPRSRIEHGGAGSTLVVEADVATEVTAPALLELWYELGRLSTLRPSDEELANARQFASGTLAMSVATMAGLATTLVNLAAVGLDLTWVREHPRRLAEVTARGIYDLGVHLLAPKLLVAVVVGDATQCAEPLQAFGPWTVV